MLLLCFYMPVWSQNDPITQKQDSISSIIPAKPIQEAKPISFRVPDKSKIEEFQNNPRFNYHVERKQKAQLSWWDKLWYEITEFFGKLFSQVARSGALSFVVIMICVILVCLLLMKLLNIDYRTVLGKKKMDKPEIDFYTEDVHSMNFDELIANALKNKDYRLAIRFLYLKNLKLLADKGIIDWNAHKTNYSYQHEIGNNNLRSKFLETTLIFDYVWYGEFSVEEAQFSGIQSRMNDFSKMITNER